MNTPLPHSLPWKADQAISGCPIIVSNQGDHIANVYCQDDRDYILDAVNGRAAIEHDRDKLIGALHRLYEDSRFYHPENNESDGMKQAKAVLYPLTNLQAG